MGAFIYVCENIKRTRQPRTSWGFLVLPNWRPQMNPCSCTCEFTFTSNSCKSDCHWQLCDAISSYAISRSQEPTTNADLETCDICVVPHTEKASYHGPSSGRILVYWRLLHRLLDLMVPKAIGTGFKPHRRLFKSFEKRPHRSQTPVSPVPLG